MSDMMDTVSIVGHSFPAGMYPARVSSLQPELHVFRILALFIVKDQLSEKSHPKYQFNCAVFL